MLVSLIPLFDKELRVGAYSIFSQKKNYFINPASQATAFNDNAQAINGMEIINEVGIDTLSPDVPIFVPVNNIAIFSDINDVCKDVAKKRIVFLIDNSFAGKQIYIDRITELKKDGYSFAIRSLPITDYENNRNLLALMDYILINTKKIDAMKVKLYFQALFPNIQLIVANLKTQDEFRNYSKGGLFDLYEGEFYRIPSGDKDTEVAPLKTNYLELLNIVNSPDFELTDAADIIGRDTALVMELLKTVSHMSVNSEITSIRHAAAMLGQKELKRWINTVVTKELCSDRPSEITRISLLRAKFAEELSDIFELKGFASELFLMGLFSVIDLILDMPMGEAVKKVLLPKKVTEALTTRKGEYAEVLKFIEAYENADWEEVDRIMLLKQKKDNDVYLAYISSFKWYRNIININ